jgi:phosphohistidine phosphatase
MTTLVLMRHGVAETEHPDGDAARGLTAHGLRDAHAAARGLVALGVRPDLVVTSPLVRCRQTAEAVAAAAGCPLVSDPRLAPGMTTDDVLDVVIGHPDAPTILVCSHQPGLTYSLGEIAECGLVDFMRPQAAVVDLPRPRRAQGRLLATLPPRILRAADPEGGGS